MLDETDTLGLEPSEEIQPPEEKSNRTFLIVAIIFGGLIFISLACIAGYLLLVRAPRTSQMATQAAQQTAIQAGSETKVAEQTLTAVAAGWTKTPQPTPISTNTSRPTQATFTPVINLTTPTETATTDPATMAAMQTQLAGQMTQTAAAQSTRAIGGEGPLPTTGFADEVGLPLLVLLTLALLAVIFIARRMRKAPNY